MGKVQGSDYKPYWNCAPGLSAHLPGCIGHFRAIRGSQLGLLLFSANLAAKQQSKPTIGFEFASTTSPNNPGRSFFTRLVQTMGQHFRVDNPEENIGTQLGTTSTATSAKARNKYSFNAQAHFTGLRWAIEHTRVKALLHIRLIIGSIEEPRDDSKTIERLEFLDGYLPPKIIDISRKRPAHFTELDKQRSKSDGRPGGGQGGGRESDQRIPDGHASGE